MQLEKLVNQEGQKKKQGMYAIYKRCISSRRNIAIAPNVVTLGIL